MKRKFIPDEKVLFIAQFGTAFSLSSIIVLLPFYIQSISEYSAGKTLLWTGLILSASNIGAAIFSPVWGKLSSRVNPKILYARGIMSHAVILLVMGFTQNLTSLLILRFLQGIMGGISTIGLIILKKSVPENKISPEVGKFQSSITLGQLFGPATGAFIAYKINFFSAFIFSSAIMFIILTYTTVFLRKSEKIDEKEIKSKRTKTNFLDLWFLSFAATVHSVYLPAVLPDILKSFEFYNEKAVMSAGIIVFIYGTSAFAGAYILPSLFSGEKTYIVLFFLAGISSFFQIMHIAADNVTLFTLFRLLQTFFIAAIMPLCLGIVARRYSGTQIGILNTARFTGNASAPILSTFILSYFGLKSVYLFLSILTLVPLLSIAKNKDKHHQ